MLYQLKQTKLLANATRIRSVIKQYPTLVSNYPGGKTTISSIAIIEIHKEN